MTALGVSAGPPPGSEPSRKRAVITKGGRRAALTVTDQSMASLSNFAVGVVVARVAGARGLGGFSLAYAGWVMLGSIHRALVTDPMAIAGDARDPEARPRVQRGFGAEVLLGTSAAGVFALIGAILLASGAPAFGLAMLAMAPWLPALLVQDYWRWVGFMSRRPGRALVNDSTYNVVQAAAFAGIFLAHSHSVAAVIAAWGLGATAGSLLGLRQNGVRASLRGGLALLRDRWSLSKWLASTALVNNGASQAYQVVVAAILGPAGLGSLKAAQNLVMGPAGVLIQAGGSIGLPEASRAYDEKGWAGMLRVTRAIMVAGLLSGLASVAVVWGWGRDLLTLVYGPSFANLRSVSLIIGIAFISLASLLGPVLVLKATRNTRWLFHVQVVTLGLSVANAAALSAIWGLDGAAAAIVATCAGTMVVLRWYQHKVATGPEGQGAVASSRLPADDGLPDVVALP